MKIIDFTNYSTGTLVVYSPHWIYHINYKPDKNKIGMIIDKKYYPGYNNQIICWPVIQWEGSGIGQLCHPVNVIPYRKSQLKESKWIEIPD